jgi:ribonuclease HII
MSKLSATVDRFVEERRLLAAGIRLIAGIDEAGRGPLAGPVLAAAVVFPEETIRDGLPADLAGLNDSKQLTAAQREFFFGVLTGWPDLDFSIARVEPDLIDQWNILRATHRAMHEAVSNLRRRPQHVLVDGLPVATLPLPHTALVKGDARSYSIAAASVLAKVTRDRIMATYDRLYPAYGFARHKGYPTREHLAALARHGPCPIHRRSFAPLKPVPGREFAAFTR